MQHIIWMSSICFEKYNSKLVSKRTQNFLPPLSCFKCKWNLHNFLSPSTIRQHIPNTNTFKAFAHTWLVYNCSYIIICLCQRVHSYHLALFDQLSGSNYNIELISNVDNFNEINELKSYTLKKIPSRQLIVFYCYLLY